MINQYAIQYAYDKKIVTEIDNKLKLLGFENPYRSNLYLKNFPINNIGRLRYGEYIFGIFRNFGSAEAFLDINSGSFSRVTIETPGEKFYSAYFPKNEFINLRPLTVMKYTDDKTCTESDCLIVEEVLR